MDKCLYVLLVEDDEDDYLILKELVQSHGRGERGLAYKLDWAQSYEKAVEALKSNSYDVCLVDYRLGVYSGLDVLKEAERNNWKGPFILLTGQGSYQVDLEAMQAGAADYLVKSQINAPLLERSIRYAIERNKAKQELEDRVQERTAELNEANQELTAEINRRRLAEEVLRESEARFRTLADTTSAAILILHESQILYANPATRFITGYEPEELLNTEIWPIIHPSYQSVLKNGGPVFEWMEGIPTRYELKIIKKSGEERWVDVTSGKLVYGGRSAWILTAFDITERDLAEQELRKAKAELEERVRERTNQLNALYSATTSLLTTIDLDALLAKILDAAQTAIPVAENVFLHLVAPDTGQLRVRANMGQHDPRILKVLMPRSKDFAARAIREQKPLLLTEISEEETSEKAFAAIRSAIVAPLTWDAKITGALSLGSSQPAAFTEADLKLLGSFATATSAAIQNAMLYAEVQRLAVTDPLTGRLNRRGLIDQGSREMERFNRFGRPLAAILLDIDNFKQINDTFGHSTGDQVIQEVASRCYNNLRRMDIIARFGGDEFAILLPETDLFSASEVAERIRLGISTVPFATDAGSFDVTISVGVAKAIPGVTNLETLFAQADIALYQAKENGSNRVEVR
jgi:diguanylate cyclase (GGDEF)-like protein/PAS domain S-box-containing protein